MTKFFQKTIVVFIISITAYLICTPTAIAAKTINNFLAKPTGKFGVGFQDFHWINQNVCPDPNFNGKNKDDFSADNTNYCHEIMVRIYYPTLERQEARTPYNSLFIKKNQDIFREIPSIPKEQIEDLSQLRSFTIAKASLVPEKKFPVLLFSPGFGCPAELYENFITELASQGYIVVGINTPFINLTALPNGHIIQPARPRNREEIERIFVALQSKDLMYVFEKLHTLHNTNPLFLSMDLTHVGLFGHSIGARVLADVSHTHPGIFQAGVTLDIGFDTTGASRGKFSMPFMHQISSKLKDSPWPFTFDLGNNNYVVGFTPNEQDYDYSSHMSFSDLSTLQYTPAFIAYQKYLRASIMDGFSLVFLSHEPTEEEAKHFSNATYVLIKRDKWYFAWYNGAQKIDEVTSSQVRHGLDDALAKLPNKAPEELGESEREPVKQIVMSLHRGNAELFGKADGWRLNDSINTNLLHFFDSFIKGQLNPAFKKCLTLSKNTYIKCGPGQA